jgi:hypothetical protein
VVRNFLSQASLPRVTANLTSIRFRIASRQPHEGCFSGTITPKQADAFTFFNLQVDAIKDGGSAEGDMNVEKREEGHGRSADKQREGASRKREEGIKGKLKIKN